MRRRCVDAARLRALCARDAMPRDGFVAHAPWRAVSSAGAAQKAGQDASSSRGGGAVRGVDDFDARGGARERERGSVGPTFASSSSTTAHVRAAVREEDDTGAVSTSGGVSASAFSGAFELVRQHGDVAAVCLTSAILMTAHSCASPVLPMLANEFGANATEIGATMSAFAAGRLLFNLPCGMFADTYGRRPLMIAGPAVTTIGMLWSYTSGGLGELLAARAVAGIGSSMFMSGATAMLADLSTHGNRARILGANQAAVLAGAAAGPALGGAIAGAEGMSIRSPFLAVAGLSSLAMTHSYFKVSETRPMATAVDDTVKPSKHWYCDGHPIENPSEVLEGEGVVKPVVVADASTAQDAAMGRLVKSVDFWSVCGLNAALFFSGAGGRGTLLPILAYQSFGFTPDALGALFSAMAVTSLLGLGPAAAITDAVGRKAVIAPCVIMSAASVALIGTTTDPFAFTAASILWAAAGSLMGTAPAAYAADISPKNIRGSALGIYRTCGDVGLLFGPLALGALADSAGIPAALGANAALLTLAGGVFHFTAREIKRDAGAKSAAALGSSQSHKSHQRTA